MGVAAAAAQAVEPGWVIVVLAAGVFNTIAAVNMFIAGVRAEQSRLWDWTSKRLPRLGER